MLKLRTKSGLISLNDYSSHFSNVEEPWVRGAFKTHNDSPLTSVSLQLNHLPLEHELTLNCESYSDEEYFVFKHFFKGELLHLDAILPARAINLSFVFKKWKEMVESFAYAGLTSYISGEAISLKRASECLKASQQEKKVIESKPTPPKSLKNDVFVKIQDIKLSLEELHSKDIFYKRPLNDLIHDWVQSYTSNTCPELELEKQEQSEESYNLITPNTAFAVLFGKDNVHSFTLPITFQLGLNVEHPTEVNDGECSSQWVLRVDFQGKMVAYLKLGSAFEAGCFNYEDEFLGILSEAFERISTFENLMELLALEAVSGVKASITLAEEEFHRLTTERPSYQSEQLPVQGHYGGSCQSQGIARPIHQAAPQMPVYPASFNRC